MDDIKTLRRTDYTRYLRPRGPSLEPKPALAQVPNPELMTVSIRIKLPDYANWRLYVFARQYPYISLAAAVTGLILLVIAGDIMTWLWHAVRGAGGRG